MPRLQNIEVEFSASPLRDNRIWYKSYRKAAIDDFIARMKDVSNEIVKEGVISFLETEYVAGLHRAKHDEYAVRHFE